MLTFIVNKDQVDNQFSIQDLKKFSEEKKARIIIKGVLTLYCGVVTWIQ